MSDDWKARRRQRDERNPNFSERNPSRMEQIPNPAERNPNANASIPSPDLVFSMSYADPQPHFLFLKLIPAANAAAKQASRVRRQVVRRSFGLRFRFLRLFEQVSEGLAPLYDRGRLGAVLSPTCRPRSLIEREKGTRRPRIPGS